LISTHFVAAPASPVTMSVLKVITEAPDESSTEATTKLTPFGLAPQV
jgi:hypothetical protein